MDHLDKLLAKTVAHEQAPFIVAGVGTSRRATYSGAAGDAIFGREATPDTVFRMFSMTKAIGSVAAMILIDRGLLQIDTHVANILPDWKKMRVLDGFDGEQPRLRAPETTATVRHLATHTSGLEYELWNVDMAKYLSVTGHPGMASGLKKSLMCPLMTDPGTRWGYGPGIDWLGQLVEKIDGRKIDIFCQEEIFNPLAMHSTAFEPDQFVDRLSAVSIRDENQKFAPFDIAPPPKPEFYGMGQSLYSTAPDYLRFLRMILNKGQLGGHRILSESAVSDMFQDHMNGLAFRTMRTISPLTHDVVLQGGTVHGLACTINVDDLPDKRSAGSQSWAGMCNTHFWLDPKQDVAAVFMTQTLPFLDPPLMQAYDAFEREVYASL